MRDPKLYQIAPHHKFNCQLQPTPIKRFSTFIDMENYRHPQQYAENFFVYQFGLCRIAFSKVISVSSERSELPFV